MKRLNLPPFLSDVVGDKVARPVLAAACVALAAIGLDPPILEPAMPSVQAAMRAAPELQSLLLVAAVWKAAAVLIGGVLADVFRSRRLLYLGLLGLAGASVAAIFVTEGPAFFLIRLTSSFCIGLVLPFLIGAVGSSYSGPARATAIGFAYAAFGAATASAPVLAMINGVRGPYSLAFAVCALASLLAFVATRRWLPAMPHASRGQRPLIVSTALWAFGVTAIVASVVNLRIDPLDNLVVVVGIACIVAAYVILRRNPARDGERVNLRPVAVVLVVGIIIGFAQVVPLIKLPQFFIYIQGLPSLVATLAIAPFVLALILAGPISGWLLQRVGPRALITGGLVAVGVADVLLAAILVPSSGYVLFVVPFILIGAGFVIATAVRTALIFASVPKQMPGSAAALNEASLGLGSRLGTIFSTVVATQVAIRVYSETLVGLPADVAESRLNSLSELLFALGLPSFPELVELVDQASRPLYSEAALTGVRVTLLVPGVLAILCGLVAFALLPKREPVRVIFDYADEREITP